MNPFSKNETIGVSLILTAIFIVTFLNLRIALRRARDAQRRADIGAISDALNKYQKDFGYFPPVTSDNKILACKGQNFGNLPEDLNQDEKMKAFLASLRGCEWGVDGLRDVTDDNYPPYLEKLHSDPQKGQGLNYLYLSNTRRYQLYAYLEGGAEEVGFRQGIVERKLNCGNKICNFGKAFADTPLEISIEEYENELIK
jgi:hypothetical protein